MKKIIVSAVAVVLLSFGIAYSQGDLIVNGDLGIGTAAPAARLDLKQTSDAAGEGIRLTNAAGDTSVELFISSNKGVALVASSNVIQFAFNNDFKLRPDDKFIFGGDEYSFGSSSGKLFINLWDEFGETIMSFDSNKNVGFGIDNTIYPLEMASGAHVTAGGVWTNASSRQLKENITIFSSDRALETLKGLIPVEYNYTSESEEKYLGFIAEDVPAAVAMNDRKSLSPMDIVAVLTSVVKEQQGTINKLSEKLERLEKQLNH
ncbi:MAG: tail fiber domain-containing protein [Nitrospira sp.]|nr:tail fiber domain-containing protein [Nitrospira sp.]